MHVTFGKKLIHKIFFCFKYLIEMEGLKCREYTPEIKTELKQ